MICFVIIIGVVIYYLVKNNADINFKSHNSDSAEELLKLKYVKGEIDDDAYIRMLKVLKEK